MRIPARARLIGLSAVLLALACNLTTAVPTPTARPVLPTATSAAAPTLFASITPLAGSGGGIIVTTQPNNTCTPPFGWVQYVIEFGRFAECAGGRHRDDHAGDRER